jgi:translation initiation factor 2B subunit (eIF-2B alpha/beta/delta family)
MARTEVSSLAHAHLNAFAELVHKHQPARALAQFSKYLDAQPQDVVSANAFHYVTHAVGEDASEELLQRANHARSQINACNAQLAAFAKAKLSNRTIVAHPLDALSASFLQSAKSVRFLNANPSALHDFPLTKLEAHKPLGATQALDNADMLLLEPRAITPEGVVVERGGRLLAELASARGVPVYVLGTSWHATPQWKASRTEELVPAAALTGILSEHGIYAHKEFLGRVEKTFPWLLTSP